MLSIIDYKMGNIRSVQKALEKLGFGSEITDDPVVIKRSKGIILPGVGSFGAAMANLKPLIPVIREEIAKNKPFLGICLGLQLIFESSDENPGVNGMGLLKGHSKRFDLPHDMKVPHMGWNNIKINKKSPILTGIPDGQQMYFVHSYYVVPEDKDVILTTTDYGMDFTSSIAKGNIFATQFHPEKSGEIGLEIYRNFGNMCSL
ncbi:MAG: imidazole glycerol phosphate synthase subunit HisH [bacterium]